MSGKRFRERESEYEKDVEIIFLKIEIERKRSGGHFGLRRINDNLKKECFNQIWLISYVLQ